ncbi:MAG: rRNA maturation RNase YbeY [Leptolyngbyaceae cyanobacterium CRU_2_3]|nr:rRNA maturation RNase YbeY [Leptolyngbyaceae cyanobacterium CRU_2_3]
MPELLPVQVEIVVQDCFFIPAQLSVPVTEETWQAWFQNWLTVLQPSLLERQISAQSYELSLRLTDDAEIQGFNAQYRHKDQPTDVLAFATLETDYPQLEEQADQPLYLGDIIISVETAQVQATQQQHSLKQELSWLGAHALLHLLGWDHPDENSLLCMLKQQQCLLQSVGLPTPSF